MESIAKMAADHAARHVADNIKWHKAENHEATKEFKKIRKETDDKKKKVKNATHNSIKSSIEKAVIKSMAPVKMHENPLDSWASSSSSL